MRVMTASDTPLIQTYLEKRDTLLRLFTASLGRPELAEDILQELYLKVEKVGPDLRVDNPLGYLFRAANNIYLNRLRAQGSQVVRDEAWHDAHTEMVGTEAIAAEPSAEAALIHKQTLAGTLAALAELDDTTQAVVRLNRFEGLTQKEVAGRLGLSLATVERRLGAALRHLMQWRQATNDDP